ncbi:uncharacterized protein METZ01_LOCUS122041 [marine metagenome]|uniref:Flippase-like domain-containing protein n=1 Tax=marine metagenome TaxID=408172 RepID=A0A381XYF5_9ZZZZ
MRDHVRTVIGLGLAVGLMALFLRNADFASVWSEIRSARFDLVCGSLLAIALSYAFRVRRWQQLLGPIGQVGFLAAWRATAIGFATTAVLPGRLGEVLRPYLLARGEQLSASAVFATIVLERLLDLIVVVTLLGVFLLFFSGTVRAVDWPALNALRGVGLVAAAVAAASLALIVFAARAPERLRDVMGRVAGVLPVGVAGSAGRFFAKFSAGLGVAREPGRLLVALSWSLPVWLSVALSAWCVCHAFDIPLSLSGSLLVMVLMVFGVAVPTPAGVGGFHAGFQAGVMGLYDAPVDAAVGAALVTHALSFGPITVVGIVLMLRTGLTLKGAATLAVDGTRMGDQEGLGSERRTGEGE